MQTTSVKLLIVSDHILFRETLKNYLHRQPEIDLSIQVTGFQHLMEQLRESGPNVLLADIAVPSLSGRDFIKNIRANYPETRIIALSTCTDPYQVNSLIELGVHGYISKSDEPEELMEAIQTVADHKIFRNKSFAEAMYHNKQNGSTYNGGKNYLKFNDREQKVLQLLWREKSNKEIADALYLSVRSIEKIRQDMKEKLGIKSTIGLLKYGLKNNLIGQEEYLVDEVKEDQFSTVS